MKHDITLIFAESDFLIDQSVFPPLGILYLSAYLNKWGFNVQCLDLGAGDRMEDATADIIGISFTTPQKSSAYRCLKYFKEQGKITIAGGPHPTHMSDECRNMGFDHVIKGEGEVPLFNLLSFLTGSDLVIRQDHGIDSIPYPDRENLDIQRYKYKINGQLATPIMTSRGCPGNCSFCDKITDRFRIQSAERTISEIEYIHAMHGFKAFMIYDDVFIAHKKRLTAIADHFEHSGFLFRCFARTDMITESVCNDLKRMGVVEVGLGVESGSSEILRRNLKGTTPEINTAAVKMLQAVGIRVKTFIIVGLPGESTVTIADTFRWIQEAQPDDIDVTILQPLPGSAIFKDPGKYGIEFSYGSSSCHFKGRPGEYVSSSRTTLLSAESIVRYRDLIENEFKDWG